MEIQFRPILADNTQYLWEMLYLAIYVAPGDEPPAREIIHAPDLARYVERWGRHGDVGFYAVRGDGPPVGAAWMRLWSAGNRGYGWVDDLIPELSLAVVPDQRGKGIGSRLLTYLLDTTQSTCPRVSLSVTAGNPAQRLYLRSGFRTVHDDGSSLTMLRVNKEKAG